MNNVYETKQMIKREVKAEFKHQQKQALKSVLAVYAIAGGVFALCKYAEHPCVKQAIREVKKV